MGVMVHGTHRKDGPADLCISRCHSSLEHWCCQRVAVLRHREQALDNRVGRTRSLADTHERRCRNQTTLRQDSHRYLRIEAVDRASLEPADNISSVATEHLSMQPSNRMLSGLRPRSGRFGHEQAFEFPFASADPVHQSVALCVDESRVEFPLDR